MKINVEKEIEALKLMARNWKRGFKTWITPGEDNSYVYQEFLDDIETHLLPYTNRLVEIEAIDQQGAKELIGYYLAQLEELKEYGG